VILVDTSVWIDHFKNVPTNLVALLAAENVLMHDFVVGELAAGSLRDRDRTIEILLALPRGPVVAIEKVVALMTRERLFETGLGFVDTALLASVLAGPGTMLLTSDKRQQAAAVDLGIAYTRA